MDKIEKIRQEIERMKRNAESAKKEWNDGNYNQNAFAEDCRISSFDHLLSFIDTLSEEPDKSMEEEMEEFFETMPVLEHENIFDVTFQKIARHFAKWQKEQMMKEAVEGEISSVDVGDDSYVKTLKMLELQKAIRNYNVGDKVRIVIFKAEEE